MIPLGIRLNNPGNIRRTAIAWTGEDSSYTGDYCRFSDPEWGIRAMARILMRYQARGIHTLRGAISEWAPAVENDTEQYLANVSSWTGIDPDTKTLLETPPIIKAIIRQEQGTQPYDDSTIDLAITLADPQPET